MKELLPDSIETCYNIRRLGNRYRVVVERPSWAIQLEDGYRYVSIDRLVNHNWTHIPGTATTHHDEQSADQKVLHLYRTFEPKED